MQCKSTDCFHAVSTTLIIVTEYSQVSCLVSAWTWYKQEQKLEKRSCQSLTGTFQHPRTCKKHKRCNVGLMEARYVKCCTSYGVLLHGYIWIPGTLYVPLSYQSLFLTRQKIFQLFIRPFACTNCPTNQSIFVNDGSESRLLTCRSSSSSHY